MPSAQAWKPRVRRESSRTGRPRPSVEPTEAARQAAGIIDQALRGAAKLWPELWGDLTETGQRMFALEVVEASMSSDPDPVTAIGHVIEAWYRTWRLRQDPAYHRAMKRAGRSPEQLEERTYTIDELRQRFSG